MAHRLEVVSKKGDARAETKKKKIESLVSKSLRGVRVVDVYTLDLELSGEELQSVASILHNPINQEVLIDRGFIPENFNWAIEIGFLPGVTDNVGNTAQECVRDLLSKKFDKNVIFSSQMVIIDGDLSENEAKRVGKEFANELIQRIHMKSRDDYLADRGMGTVVPRVKLLEQPHIDIVDLNLDNEGLTRLGKEGIRNKDGTTRGPLALDLNYMKAIRNYFSKEGRNPTDIELESIAQTWSEHCKHTIFADPIDELKDGLFKEYIKKSTNLIRKKKGERDFCISVFEDNAGGIIFDENYLISDKVETHNSPSALDPFGGSITGIVGVNRDAIGFGMGAMPIMNRYGFCFGYPEDSAPLFKGKGKTNPILSPKRVMEGVIEGVNVGGNCSGIPTPQGFVYFDDSYKGKPLVFVGTVGLIPRNINGKESHIKKALPGDLVVIVGGRVGKDGIHGATFSSEALTSGSPATAVQIGDPITQKKLSDAITKEARGLGLYNSVTDNGAGGLSCSVAEMAKECGGFVVDLENVPVKYPGIQPWEIWVSESQERMTLSVPQDKLDSFLKLMEKRGVEAKVIGWFNDSNRAVVRYQGKNILDLEMKFLHDGLPQRPIRTSYTKETFEEPDFEIPGNMKSVLLKMLALHNITSFEFISRQYDHEVQAGSILKPLQGEGEVNGYATVLKPLYDSNKAVVTSQGITSKYSKIDCYHMAGCAIDTAVRNAVAAGCDISKMALLDNFCWCSSNESERLGQLKAAAKACYDYSVAYGTPLISGKDSMFNDFKGFDEKENPLKISVLPTLLVSSIGIMPDYKKAVSLDVKEAGDSIYVLGGTNNELGGSEYFEMIGKENGKQFVGNLVPKVSAEKALERYNLFNRAIEKEIIASAIPVNNGGLGIALAKMCIAGRLGANLDLRKLKKSEDVARNDFALFSESQSRIVVTVAPENKEEFERIFSGTEFSEIGRVAEGEFIVTGFGGSEIVKSTTKELEESYKSRFKEY